MKALSWHGKKDIRCDDVPDPQIEHPRDAIIQVSCCAICGSDLHLFDGTFLNRQESTQRSGPCSEGSVATCVATELPCDARSLRRLRNSPSGTEHQQGTP